MGSNICPFFGGGKWLWKWWLWGAFCKTKIKWHPSFGECWLTFYGQKWTVAGWTVMLTTKCGFCWVSKCLKKYGFVWKFRDPPKSTGSEPRFPSKIAILEIFGDIYHDLLSFFKQLYISYKYIYIIYILYYIIYNIYILYIYIYITESHCSECQAAMSEARELATHLEKAMVWGAKKRGVAPMT